MIETHYDMHDQGIEIGVTGHDSPCVRIEIEPSADCVIFEPELARRVAQSILEAADRAEKKR